MQGEVELGSRQSCIEDGNYETVTTRMQPSVIVGDLETVPDLGGFAAANDLVGKSDAEVREAIGVLAVVACLNVTAQSLTALHVTYQRPDHHQPNFDINCL